MSSSWTTRDLPQSGMKFDRVVSVGMVGMWEGKITAGSWTVSGQGAESRRRIPAPFYQQPEGARGDPWIKEIYISGQEGHSKSQEIISLMAEHDFHILDVENLRNHYNKTLLCWERNFKGT